MCSVRKLSCLFTVLVVTLTSLAISTRFFLGSFRIDQMIPQSVSEGLILQDGRKLAFFFYFYHQLVLFSNTNQIGTT